MNLRLPFALASLLFVSSCATISEPAKTPSLTAEYPHIDAKCRLFSLDGNLIRSMQDGSHCLYEADGSVAVQYSNRIVKYDRHLKPLWTVKGQFLHHTFKKSEVTGNYLYFDSKFVTVGKITYRTDIFKVLTSDGVPLKSVSIDQLLPQFQKFNTVAAPPVKTTWYDEKVPQYKENFEASHVNSFYEVIDTVNGVNTLKGYILNCIYHKKVLFLDKELSKVIAMVDMGSRFVHDAQYINSEKLRFYQNCNPKNGVPFSAVIEYGLKTQKFTEIYSAQKSGICSMACGSVQTIANNRIFVTHGNCFKHPDSISVPILEIINLETGAVQTLKMASGAQFGMAFLIDASAHMKLNAGP